MRFKSLVNGNVTKLIGKKIVDTHVLHDHWRKLSNLALIGKQDDRRRVTLRFCDKLLMIGCGLSPSPEISPTRWIVTIAQKIKQRLIGQRQNRSVLRYRRLQSFEEICDEWSVRHPNTASPQIQQLRFMRHVWKRDRTNHPQI